MAAFAKKPRLQTLPARIFHTNALNKLVMMSGAQKIREMQNGENSVGLR